MQRYTPTLLPSKCARGCRRRPGTRHQKHVLLCGPKRRGLAADMWGTGAENIGPLANRSHPRRLPECEQRARPNVANHMCSIDSPGADRANFFVAPPYGNKEHTTDIAKRPPPRRHTTPRTRTRLTRETQCAPPPLADAVARAMLYAGVLGVGVPRRIKRTQNLLFGRRRMPAA